MLKIHARALAWALGLMVAAVLDCGIATSVAAVTPYDFTGHWTGEWAEEGGHMGTLTADLESVAPAKFTPRSPNEHGARYVQGSRRRRHEKPWHVYAHEVCCKLMV